MFLWHVPFWHIATPPVLCIASAPSIHIAPLHTVPFQVVYVDNDPEDLDVGSPVVQAREMSPEVIDDVENVEEIDHPDVLMVEETKKQEEGTMWTRGAIIRTAIMILVVVAGAVLLAFTEHAHHHAVEKEPHGAHKYALSRQTPVEIDLMDHDYLSFVQVQSNRRGGAGEGEAQQTGQHWSERVQLLRNVGH